MELDLENFEKLLDYHHLKMDDVLKTYEQYVKDSEGSLDGSKSILVSIVPMLMFPPRVSFCITVNKPEEIQEKVGYFDIAKYTRRNVH